MKTKPVIIITQESLDHLKNDYNKLRVHTRPKTKHYQLAKVMSWELFLETLIRYVGTYNYNTRFSISISRVVNHYIQQALEDIFVREPGDYIRIDGDLMSLVYEILKHLTIQGSDLGKYICVANVDVRLIFEPL